MNNDSQLQKSVQDELAWEPSVTAAHIGVAAKDGVVTVSGHVDTYSEKCAAEKAGVIRLTGTVPTFNDKWVADSTAWRAPGVIGVENDIAVV